MAVLAWKLAPGPETVAAKPAEATVSAAPAADVSSKSVAVLPFTDLSPAHDQEYFSDGMAEEILNALAQVKDLKVAGRTSSFFFKGKNEDLRTIGRTLGVANVLEGSVRKQGDVVRITAQLIQVSDGFHLWSKTYDGDLKDVFELQERIARAITDQLQIVIAGAQKSRLVPVAYDQLRGVRAISPGDGGLQSSRWSAHGRSDRQAGRGHTAGSEVRPRARALGIFVRHCRDLHGRRSGDDVGGGRT